PAPRAPSTSTSLTSSSRRSTRSRRSSGKPRPPEPRFPSSGPSRTCVAGPTLFVHRSCPGPRCAHGGRERSGGVGGRPFDGVMDTDELIRTHLPLVDSIARRFRGRGEPFEDLRQCGALGLVLAAKRWDPARGVTFGAYASPLVAGEIRRHLRDHGRLVRLPRRVWESAGRCRGAARELTAVLGRSPTTEEIADHVGLEPAAVIEAMTASAWPAPLEDVVSMVLDRSPDVQPPPRLD